MYILFSIGEKGKMKKRLFFNKMLLLASISSSLFLFSCGKLDNQVVFKGGIVTFKEVDGDKIEVGLPYQDQYLVPAWPETLCIYRLLLLEAVHILSFLTPIIDY